MSNQPHTCGIRCIQVQENLLTLRQILSQIQFTLIPGKRKMSMYTWCLHSTFKVMLKVLEFSSVCCVRPVTTETIKVEWNSDIGSLVI